MFDLHSGDHMKMLVPRAPQLEHCTGKVGAGTRSRRASWDRICLLSPPGRSGDTGALGSLETHTGLVVSQPPADVGSSVDAVVSQVSSEKLSQRPNLSQSHSK